MNNCLYCNKPTDNPMYCSRSCAAKENNKIPKRVKKIWLCVECDKEAKPNRTRCPDCIKDGIRGRTRTDKLLLLRKEGRPIPITRTKRPPKYSRELLEYIVRDSKTIPVCYSHLHFPLSDKLLVFVIHDTSLPPYERFVVRFQEWGKVHHIQS